MPSGPERRGAGTARDANVGVCYCFDARRQWGYGDYTPKEKIGVYRALKKFSDTTELIKATPLFFMISTS
jgi:hypothetical protein